MKLLTLIALAFSTSLVVAHRGAPPESAKAVLAAAQSTAARSGKSVFVGFHASWCGWCKKMEKVLAQPDVKPIWEKHFVSVWLVVLETPENRSLEHAGALEILAANGGEGSGIPYFYFTDAKGKTLATSFRPGEGEKKGGNVGCPYEPEEVAWFMTMLDKSAPKMSADEKGKLKAAFEALKKADKKGGEKA